MQKPTELDPQAQLQDGESVKTTGPDMGPIFALTIGINKYKNQGAVIKNLSGCVADADDVEKFLSTNLHVPRENIRVTSLRDERATAAITKALESIAKDPLIPKDAIIFIFYAGHGTQAPAPADFKWTDSKQIQMLMPYDFYPGLQSTTPTAAPPETSSLGDKRSAEATADATIIKNGLFDVHLGQLIENIANSKGKNITVVFDCCHSGSATRGGEHIAARGVDLLDSSKLDLDVLSAVYSRSNRGGKVPEGHKNRGLACHVLLTACNQSEYAYEKNGRGVFTTTLMELLRNSEDLDQLTYSDIIGSIPILNGQKPQCEGVNKDHIFLNNCVVDSSRILRSLIQNGSGYEIHAGEAHGVTVKAQFAIYDTKACTKELGRLEVKDTSPFHSVLKFSEGAQPFNIPKAAFALLTGITQDLHILVEDDELRSVFEAIEKQVPTTNAFRSSFKIVASRDDKPDLIIASKGGTAQFLIQDRPCCDAGLYEIYHRPETGEKSMANILLGAARFYRNLRCTTSAKVHISSQILFECYELTDNGLDDKLCQLMKPANDHDLFVRSTDTNSLVHGNIELEIDGSDKSYGFCIKNKSGVPLFVSVFYFNMSDLSIALYYQPPTARGQDQFPSIESGCSLTIGYGTGGFPPQTFYLEENQKVDVGYIKLFLTTEYVDYSSVPQLSPFKVDDGRACASQYPNSNLWDTMLIRVVQWKEGTTKKLELMSKAHQTQITSGKAYISYVNYR